METKTKDRKAAKSAASANVTEGSETKRLGRPVNPESKRQKELAGKESTGIVLSDGSIYKPVGRKPDPTSKRQIMLATKGTGDPKQKGRPKMTEEEKAAAKAKREALKAQAIAEGKLSA